MIPLVLGSYPGSPWLADWSPRKLGNRPVHVHRDGGFELTALRAAPFDRFLFLQDSCQILHPAFWDIIDGLTESTWLFGWPGMYLGVYDRTTLQPVLDAAPALVDKETSIEWEHRIRHVLDYPVLWPDVVDATGRLEERHGRTNLVLDNRYLRKWKGTWA
jgi:hypothetical protein